MTLQLIFILSFFVVMPIVIFVWGRSISKKVEKKVWASFYKKYPRKLQAKWTVESEEDLRTLHGMDVEDEVK
jgi:hypothetical protein